MRKLIAHYDFSSNYNGAEHVKAYIKCWVNYDVTTLSGGRVRVDIGTAEFEYSAWFTTGDRSKYCTRCCGEWRAFWGNGKGEIMSFNSSTLASTAGAAIPIGTIKRSVDMSASMYVDPGETRYFLIYDSTAPGDCGLGSASLEYTNSSAPPPPPSPDSWTATLYYNANGGSGAPSSQSRNTTSSSTSFTVSNTVPTRKHWIFHGWSTSRKTGWNFSSDAEYRGGDSITISEGEGSKTLYAVWEYTYRPAAIRKGDKWMSCDRDKSCSSGTCSLKGGEFAVRKDSSWKSIRLRRRQSTGDATIRKGSDWIPLELIGEEGAPHDVSY